MYPFSALGLYLNAVAVEGNGGLRLSWVILFAEMHIALLHVLIIFPVKMLLASALGGLSHV